MLESDDDKAIHRFDPVHEKIDIGTYDLTFKVLVHFYQVSNGMLTVAFSRLAYI